MSARDDDHLLKRRGIGERGEHRGKELDLLHAAVAGRRARGEDDPRGLS